MPFFNANFQNFGNIMFFCRFHFFLQPKLFSAVSQPICTKFGTNASSCMQLKQTRAIFEMLKNQVTMAVRVVTSYRLCMDRRAVCVWTVKKTAIYFRHSCCESWPNSTLIMLCRMSRVAFEYYIYGVQCIGMHHSHCFLTTLH